MSDTPTGTPIPGTTDEPAHIAQLRADAESGRIAAAETARLQREMAFIKAGVDVDSTKGKMIMLDHADRELTAEAIAATVAKIDGELGVTPPPPPPDPTATPGTPEHQLLQAQAGLQGTGQPAPITPPAPKAGKDRAVDDYHNALQGGMPLEEAREVGINTLIRSAQEGDRSTVYDEAAWMAEREAHGHGAEHARLPDADLVPNPLGPLPSR